jgi:hypothetical protein
MMVGTDGNMASCHRIYGCTSPDGGRHGEFNKMTASTVVQHLRGQLGGVRAGASAMRRRPTGFDRVDRLSSALEQSPRAPRDTSGRTAGGIPGLYFTSRISPSTHTRAITGPNTLRCERRGQMSIHRREAGTGYWPRRQPARHRLRVGIALPSDGIERTHVGGLDDTRARS